MRLKGSVGEGGRNIKGDVLYVQILLADWLLANGQQPIEVDGIVGPKTASAIRASQNANTPVVDGLVEPGRASIRSLEERHLVLVMSSIQIRPQYRRRALPSYLPSQWSEAYLNKLRG